jgi:outer membrane protein OmpA-like peptidoglycan-associated protein
MNSKSCFHVFPLLLCLLFTAQLARTQRVPMHDLNGTWTIPDGTVIDVVQYGNRLEGRVLVPSPEFVSTWGWTSGELYLEGVVNAGSFSGKRYVHFPQNSKTLCPNTGTQSTELEFQIVGPNTLMGRYRNRTLWTNCSISEASWVPIDLSRKKFEIAETSSQINIKVRDGILFDFDRDQLKPQALTVLKDIKELVIDKQRFAGVLVEGHTDDRGSESHNENLSARRAQAVAHWLIENRLEKNVEAKGFGNRQPVVPNTNSANRARNRRVEIKLVK